MNNVQPQIQMPIGSRIWLFINSSFGVFLLSGVLLGGASWLYDSFQQRARQLEIENAKKIAAASEIKYRSLLILDILKKPQLTSKNIVALRDIFNGRLPYQSIDKEYQDVSLLSVSLTLDPTLLTQRLKTDLNFSEINDRSAYRSWQQNQGLIGLAVYLNNLGEEPATGPFQALAPAIRFQMDNFLHHAETVGNNISGDSQNKGLGGE